MPLRAVIEGKPVTAPDLSDKEWKDLAARHRQGLPVIMPCCGAPGHLRRSKRGTRHFYHAVDSGCDYAEESKEHLEIKEQLYRICRSMNWQTYVEYPAPDRTWISDVYAVRDGRRVAFEIQISAIPLSELEDRDRKYRDNGIESYWLLENFLGRSREFRSWYDSHLRAESRPGQRVPYIDDSLFGTGPENHIFITKGIRSVGMHAKTQLLFTTRNTALSLTDWGKNVLNGNYRAYLEGTAASCNRNRRLKDMAAQSLIRFREYYDRIIRSVTYQKEADSLYRIFQSRSPAPAAGAVQKKFDTIYAELAWLEQEYRSIVSEHYGLFRWKTTGAPGKPVLVFRLESESKIRKLQDCIKTLDQWEASFTAAVGDLERELGR